jgi:AcrR family transcriptional regulator
VELAPDKVWGNPTARRRDILAAAATIVEADGYHALTMRAVGAMANVSPGTIYQYFQNKDDLFTHLIVGLIDELRVALEALPSTTGTSGVLRAALPHVVEQWRCLGSTAASWGPDLLGPGPGVVTCRQAWTAMLDAFAAALRRGAAHDGQCVVDEPGMVQFVWAALTGLADDLVRGWSASNGLSPDQLTTTTIAATARGITADQRPSRRRR